MSSEAGLSLLEQSDAGRIVDTNLSRLKSCPKTNTPYLFADDRETRTRKLVKAMCKQWGCEYCSHRLMRYNLARIINGYNTLSQANVKFNFVTLTMHEKLFTFEDTVRVWRSAWAKLSARMRRHAKKRSENPQYVYIPEKHKDGRCHIHGLFTTTLESRWWKDNLRACGGGYIAEAVEVENAGLAGWYCSKYLSKHMGQGDWIPYFRRINFSRKFPLLPKPNSDKRYAVVETGQSLLELCVQAWSLGLAVELNGDAIDSDFFLA